MGSHSRRSHAGRSAAQPDPYSHPVRTDQGRPDAYQGPGYQQPQPGYPAQPGYAPQQGYGPPATYQQPLPQPRRRKRRTAEQFYVTPDATIVNDYRVTSDQAARFYGPFGAAQARDVAKAVRSGELAPTREAESARHAIRAAAPVPAPTRHQLALLAERRKWIVTTITAVLVMIAGLIMQAVTAAGNGLCNSAIGQIGQALSGSAAAHCGLYTGVHELGSLCTWIGFLGAVTGVIVLGIAAVKIAQAGR
jgi:hypothetical protein